MEFTLMVRLLTISICIFLSLNVQPSIAMSMTGMIKKIDQVHHAIDKFEDCLDNLRIPIGGDCRESTLFDQEETIRLKYGLRDVDFLAHSEKVTLTEHKELAKMKCLSGSTCRVLKCMCRQNDIPCNKPQDKSATCETEYGILIQRITTAKIYRTAKDDGFLEPKEKFQHKIIMDEEDKELLPTEKSEEDDKEMEMPPKEKSEEELEAERTKRFIDAARNRRICLSNLRIPYRRRCNDTKEKLKERFISDLLSDNDFDEGKIPLGLTRDLERHTCHLPAFCYADKCYCSGSCRRNNPRNRSAKCVQEHFEYLLALNGTGVVTITVPELNEIESETDPPTEPSVTDYPEIEYSDDGRLLAVTRKSGADGGIFPHGIPSVGFVSYLVFLPTAHFINYGWLY